MTEFLKILGLVVFSALKFFLAPTSATIAGYTFYESFIITSVGGILGFIVFSKFGILIGNLFTQLFKKKNKKVFSKKKRMIVRFKNKYGFWGLAVLTPVLFGIPLGAILASIFYGQKKKVYLTFFTFIILWSITLSYYSIFFKSLI